MLNLSDDSPIIACSTGTQTHTAVALLRLSGFKDLKSLQPFFSLNLDAVKPRFAHLSTLLFEGESYDQVILTFFPEKKSFTGENVLELSVHGNQLNISRLIDLFVSKAHFRLASAGEFTYRALKNKKLTLTQVEGLDLLLNANSSLMLSQGLDILQGELYQKYLELYQSFIKLKSAVELSIDFSEDVGEEETAALLKESFASFFTQLESLYRRTEGSITSLLSPELSLCGQTNAGKSSLFNLLLKDNRSIVSPIAGTTRDFISEVIFIGGTHFRLIDTAGVRDTDDVIEQQGIERAFVILNRSFFRVLLINPFETNSTYLKKLHQIPFDIVLFTHCDRAHFIEELQNLDLSDVQTQGWAIVNLLSGSIEPPQKFGPIEPVFTRGPIEPTQLSGPIEPTLKSWVLNKYQEASANNPILLDRHRQSIKKVYLGALKISNNFNTIDDIAVLSSEINILGHDLADLVGITSADDVLNSIFANFCIGK